MMPAGVFPGILADRPGGFPGNFLAAEIPREFPRVIPRIARRIPRAISRMRDFPGNSCRVQKKLAPGGGGPKWSFSAILPTTNFLRLESWYGQL